MPIIDRQDAKDVDEYITRVFGAAATTRADALRALFVEKLDFVPAAGTVSFVGAPSALELPTEAELLASMDGVNVVYVQLDTERVRRSEVAVAATRVSTALGDDLLLVFTNASSSQVHFILPVFETSTPSIRRIVVQRDLPRRTAVQQMSNIYWKWAKSGDIRRALEEAFDVEAVTKRFFEEYGRVFEYSMAQVTGFGASEKEQEAKKLFVQGLFNRLMFVYFVSRKGWLKFKGSSDYLDALWNDHKGQPEDRNFYANRLQPVFFAGMNNPQAEQLGEEDPALHALIGDVPFLNGGLFERGLADNRTEVTVPDAVAERILRDLFERFNFTVLESTPLDVEVAVDPEMLGKVFEELVTGRQATGSYYTPRPVVAFMCREALKGYLEGEGTGAPAEAITAFVDEYSTDGLTMSTAPRIAAALAKVTAVDPACGSGAYLLGMLHELVELQSALFTEKLVHGSQPLYDLKLQIIEKNLYGVDVDPFAINIAMLRLWLSLTIDFEGPTPPPLPNLDFKIVCGDSLLGPNPRPENFGDLFRHRVHQIATRIAELKGRFMEATGDEKASLSSEIEHLHKEMEDAVADGPAPPGSVDWRIEFGEVFDVNGGFDIVVANPPYNVLNKFEAKNLAQDFNSLRADPMMSAAFGGVLNIFRLFVIRSLQLASTDGMVVNIVPMALMCDTTATGVRRLLFDSTEVLSFHAFPERDSVRRRLFEKVKMSTCIVIARSGYTTQSFRVRVHAGRDTSEFTHESIVSIDLLAELDPERLPIPLCSQEDIQLLQRLCSHPRLGQFAHCFTGEVDMTGDRPAITEKDTGLPLLKGAQVQRFRLSPRMSQGKFEFVGLPKLRPAKAKKCKELASASRIVLQGVTGVNEPNRLKVAILSGGKSCANSVNFLRVDEIPVRAEYLMAVLNSTTINRFFKALSTNSNVNGYEVDRLPLAIPPIDLQNRIADLSDRPASEYEGLERANGDPGPPPEIVSKLEEQIQISVAKAYGV